MSHAVGYAAQDATRPPVPFSFDRRELRLNDVAFQISYCGVCHSDLHQARNDRFVIDMASLASEKAA